MPIVPPKNLNNTNVEVEVAISFRGIAAWSAVTAVSRHLAMIYLLTNHRKREERATGNANEQGEYDLNSHRCLVVQ